MKLWGKKKDKKAKNEVKEVKEVKDVTKEDVTKQIIMTKEILQQLMMEQLVAKAQEVSEENEKLKAEIGILTPIKKEDKKQTCYIG